MSSEIGTLAPTTFAEAEISRQNEIEIAEHWRALIERLKFDWLNILIKPG